MSATAEKWLGRVAKNEFVSSLDAIQPAEELFFPQTRPIQFHKYLSNTNDHPA
jgi:hypothetical protein